MDKGTPVTPSNIHSEDSTSLSPILPTTSLVEGIPAYHPAEDEPYMSEGQICHFKTILTAMKQNLMEEVDKTVSSMREEVYKSADPSDEASRAEQIYTDLTTRTREGKLLKKIEDALNSLEHRNYGFCDTCGIEIGIRRLEARPTATLCIDCKTLDEIREKHRGG